MDNPTRHTLIMRLGDDDCETAWETFQDLYWNLIIGWASALGCDSHQASDVYQETVISLMAQLPNFHYNPKKGSFRGFLKTIVRRRVIDLFRRNGKYLQTEEPDFVRDDADASFGKESVRTEMMDDVVWIRSVCEQALRQIYPKLAPSTYQAFKMYVLEGRPVEEVCRICEVREGTLYQQKSRVLEMLYKEFRQCLVELGEILPNNSQVTAEKRQFHGALEACIKHHQELKLTMVQATPPQAVNKRLALFHKHMIDAPPTPPALLIVQANHDPAWTPLPQQGKIRLGTAADAEVCIDDEAVSVYHASLQCDAGVWQLEDLNSSNGTILNGAAIMSKQSLRPGDVFHIGNATCGLFAE